MSQKNDEVVRQPIEVSASSRRHLEERFGLRFPAALARFARIIWRLPPHSRLRRAVVRRAMKLGIEAYNRRDYEAAVSLYHPDVEYVTPPQIVPLGFDATYRGHEGRIDVQQGWVAEWGEFDLKPEELIDIGDGRVVVIGRMQGSGLGSGVSLDNDWGDVFAISAGRVVREQVFLDRDEALEAVGLRE